MNRRQLRRAILAAALIATAAPALAAERWGRVESVDPRFQKFVLVQDGTQKKYEIRISEDSVLQELDGRTMPLRDVRQIEKRRIFATVEENPAHFAMKVWFRPDVKPEQDPINPGVAATKID